MIRGKPFKKGHSINKGIKRSEEYKLRSSLSRIGKPRAGNPNNWKHSEETKKKLSDNHRSKHGFSVWNKGITGEEFKSHYKNGMQGTFKKGHKAGNRFVKGEIPWNKGLKTNYSNRKGKTMEEIFGEEKAKEMIIKMSLSKIGTKAKPKTRIKLREIRAKRIFPLKDTKIEVKIQNFLKELGIEYYTHQYIKEIEHAYQCDILVPSMNLIIECDGNYWHNYPFGNDKDKIRTAELISKGFKVLRLWESEIKTMSLNKFEERLNE